MLLSLKFLVIIFKDLRALLAEYGIIGDNKIEIFLITSNET